MNWPGVKKWLDHNRFTTVFPLVALSLWIWAAGCSPQTASVIRPGQVIDAPGLALELKEWQATVDIQAARFEAAGEDLAAQAARISQAKEAIMKLASGEAVADLPGLVTLLMGGGVLGLLTDNVRKGGVIGGLKKGVEIREG